MTKILHSQVTLLVFSFSCMAVLIRAWLKSVCFSKNEKFVNLPVSSSRISTSVVFRSSRTRAGMPPQFFRAILLSSLALPYTRFLSAPQALRCTSVIRWSNRSTRSWMPPCRRIWRQRMQGGIRRTLEGNRQIIEMFKCPLETCLMVSVQAVLKDIRAWLWKRLVVEKNLRLSSGYSFTYFFNKINSGYCGTGARFI